MRTHIDLRLIDGDLLTTAAELACFKHAQSFYGVDAEAVRRLTAGGHAEHTFEVAAGDARVVDTGGALAAPRAAFLGTARLGELRYHELRLLATRMLTLAQGERVGTLATTVHGVRAGLDEAEAVLALVGGFVDGFQRGLGGDVAEVVIVENNPARARRMREALATGLASTAGVVVRPGGAFRVERSPGFQQAPRLATAGVSSQRKPHAFVAMPFAAELDDVFHYGIARPVADAGLLCERVDQDTFSGLIIERIRERIDRARVVIADLSLANPNVYLEVGYAWGRGRPTILLVRDVKELRFDVQGYRCLVYQNIRQLEQQLTAELGRLPPLPPDPTHGP